MKRAALAIALTGCWGKAAIDISGTYHVDSIIASACADDVPVGGIAYLKIYSAAGGYAVDGCAGADGMGCARFTTLTEPIEDDGWRNIQAFATIDNQLATCKLTFSDLTALLVDTTLTMESTTYVDLVDAGSPVCTDAEALRRGDTMACDHHQLLVATQLTAP